MTRATILAALLAALLALAGCAEWSAAASGITAGASVQAHAVVKNVQQVNDLNAQVWAATACAAPWGEVVRNGSGNPGYPAAVIALCGVPPGLMMVPAPK